MIISNSVFLFSFIEFPSKRMNSRRKKNRKEIPKEIIELKKFLHAYEKLCICSNSQVNPWIKENAKRCIEKHEALTKVNESRFLTFYQIFN